jgi:predicted dehydrogenase
VTVEKAEEVVRECEAQKVKLAVAFHHRVQAIHEDREPAVNGREGLRSLRVREAIYKSARQQRKILLG